MVIKKCSGFKLSCFIVNIFIFIFPSITQQSEAFYSYANDCFAVPLKVLLEPGNSIANLSSCSVQILIYKHRSVIETVPLPESDLTGRSDSALPTWTPPCYWSSRKGFCGVRTVAEARFSFMRPSDKGLMYNFIVNEETFYYWTSKWVGADPDIQESTVLFLS